MLNLSRIETRVEDEKRIAFVFERIVELWDRSFRRSISLRGYPVDSGFGASPGDSWNEITVVFAFLEGEGRGKFGRISWITNEERNDIKLTDFRTHNHGTNSVRQRVDRVEKRWREEERKVILRWRIRRLSNDTRANYYVALRSKHLLIVSFLSTFLFQVSVLSLPFQASIDSIRFLIFIWGKSSRQTFLLKILRFFIPLPSKLRARNHVEKTNRGRW